MENWINGILECWEGRNLVFHFSPTIPPFHYSITPASVHSPQLALVVPLPIRRFEVRADDTVAAKGDEIPRLPVKPSDRAIGPGVFENVTSCRPVAELLGASQVLFHRDRAELAAMLPIVIDKLLPRGKPDVGTLDVRRYGIALECVFCFPGLVRRGLRRPARNREKQQDRKNHCPDFFRPDRESLYHEKNLSQVTPTGRLNFPVGIEFKPQNPKFSVATPAADKL
jgi:hypothetical protein